MKLGEIIREYRLINKISNGGKPIVPSVETLQKVARVIGISLDELLRKLGDEKIDIRQLSFNADEAELVDGYRQLPPNRKQLIKSLIGQLTFGHFVAPNAMSV